jgi:hypothetical protein
VFTASNRLRNLNEARKSLKNVTRARFEIGGRSRFPRTHRLGLHVGCTDGQTTKLFADRSQFRPQIRRLVNFRELRFIYKGLRKFLRRRKRLGLTGVAPSSEENCDLTKSSRHISPRRTRTRASALA